MQAYADHKQHLLEELIAAGEFTAFGDAVRAGRRRCTRKGLKLAVASSSKNAAAMLRQVRLDGGGKLADLFDADLSGRDLAHGKPDPEIFLLAAAALEVAAGTLRGGGGRAVRHRRRRGRAAWRRWASPGWATRRCWRRPAPTWW